MRRSIVFFVFAICTTLLTAQEIPTYKILKKSDRVFYNTNMPTVELKAYSGNYMPSQVDLTCIVKGFSDTLVYRFAHSYKIETGDSAGISFAFNLDPGFYKVELLHKGALVNRCNLAYEPEKVQYDLPHNEQLCESLEKGREHLQSLAFVPVVTKMKKLSGKLRTVYHLELNSIGDTSAVAYYAVPNKKGLYSAVIRFYHKDDLVPPVADAADSLIHLHIAAGSSPVDFLRAVDFLQTREEVALMNVVAVGEGLGGAYALMAAALDRRIWKTSVYAPAVKEYKIEGVSTMADMAQILRMIESPVLFGLNLDDEKSSAYDNFALYNSIESKKRYYIFVEELNPLLWRKITDNFFKRESEF